MVYQRSSSLFAEAQDYIPGGVNSPVRAFKSVGGTPLFVKEANGAYLIDEDENQYIDYINSWGPMILGHKHPEVVAALQEQINKGTSFGTPTELEVEIAKLIVSNVPNLEKIRFVNSGTEACMSAIRLARGFTGRDKILKFEGCYHGHADSFLIKAGSGAATFGTPNSPGVTQGTAKDTVLATYNSLLEVEELFKNYELAAVILEPVAGNMGCVLPEPQFLEGLRKLCTEHETLLIFDEVMTGFRLGFGGAQETFNIVADLVCYGKIIGGGLPVGAFGGRSEIMDYLAPNGPVYQAGTLSGNPLAMAAGLATLQVLLKNKETYYSQLNKTTEKIAEGITDILKEKGITHSFNYIGSMYSVFFCENKVSNFQESTVANNSTFKEFFHHMLQNGCYLPPSSFESWFMTSALKEADIDKTLEAVKAF